MRSYRNLNNNDFKSYFDLLNSTNIYLFKNLQYFFKKIIFANFLILVRQISNMSTLQIIQNSVIMSMWLLREYFRNLRRDIIASIYRIVYKVSLHLLRNSSYMW
jgi:hypothetical protein